MKFPIFKAINIIKDMTSRGTFNQYQKNIIIFKLTQKIKIEFLKEYIQFMLNIVIKCDENTKSYIELFNAIDEEKDFKSIYLPVEKLKK
jgi:predicted nucleic acid-binding protein